MKRMRHADLSMTGHYANHQDAVQDAKLADAIAAWWDQPDELAAKCAKKDAA
jgi:hypothetical protein